MEGVSSELICKCGQKGWIELNTVSDPCPNCGRRYEFIIKKGMGVIKRVYRKRKNPK
jgi:hypothetical protein